MLIGNNIRKIRTVKGWSQQQFAEFAGVTRASVGSYEEGRATPKLEVLILLASKLSLSLDQLISTELTVDAITGFRGSFPTQGTIVPQKKEILNLLNRLESLSNEVKLIKDELQEKLINLS